MPRYFIEVSYKGTLFSGFQTQQNAVTVQSEVEKGLQTFFRQTFVLTGASRTDAGVHALQNFFHFDSIEKLIDDKDMLYQKKLQQILYSLNSIIPKDIVIKNLFAVKSEAHCRFDATSREYKYFIYQNKNPFLKDRAFYYPYKIDFSLLQQAQQMIVNTNNFSSFSKRNTQVKNFICVIKKSEWKFENGLLVYNIVANRFLRGMVRGLVATMLKVATKKLTLNNFNAIIQNEDASQTDFSAPAQGLFLIEIKYKQMLNELTAVEDHFFY